MDVCYLQHPCSACIMGGAHDVGTSIMCMCILVMGSILVLSYVVPSLTYSGQ